jgi:hypothetical protein
VIAANYGKLPLAFEPNDGQSGQRADFVSRGRGYTLFLSGGEAVMSLRKPLAVGGQQSAKARLSARTPNSESRTPDVLRMKLVGANTRAAVKGTDQLPGVTNYYIGNDPKQWRTGVPNYGKVHYDDVYPGIDLVYYGNQRQLEYDFVVAPGADPRAIALSFEGPKSEKRSTKIDAKGDLVIKAEAGEVRFHKPVVYQELLGAGRRQPVEGSFKLLAENRVSFEVGSYDQTRPLVIDPLLSYATYLGGDSFDMAADIKVDGAGNAYVVGTAGSSNFTTTTGPAYAGGFSDVFVAKINPAGTAFVYSTFVGGDGGEDGNGLAVDALGGVIATGATDSTNFPMGTPVAGGTDAFIFKLDPDGALEGSRIFGGTGQDGSSRVVIDANENIYFTGPTTSTDLSILNGFQTACSSCTTNSTYDAFVAVFGGTGPSAPQLIYSSYLGGDSEDYPHGIALDSTGKVYVVGSTDSTDFPTNPPDGDPDSGIASDAFITVMDPTQSGADSLLASYYLGDASADYGYGVAVDSSDKVYVVGHTDAPMGFVAAPGFKTDNAGGLDIYVAKFDPATATAVYGTFIGGSMAEQATGIAAGSDGSAYVTGFTFSSSDFPLNGAVDNTFGSGSNTAFVAKIDPTGQLNYPFSSYVGGDGGEVGQSVAVDASGNIYVVGVTNSTNFPGTSGKLQPSCGDGGCLFGDGFVAKIQVTAVSGPQLTATPGALAFGNVATGSTSAKVVQITNTGSAALDLSSIAISGTDAASFALAASTTCTASTSLGPNESCSIGVEFSPTAEQAYSATLDVGSNDPNAAITPIDLTGTGIASAAAIDVSPAALDFGSALVGSNIDYPVEVTNTGTENLIISAIMVGGADAANFTAPAAGSTCSVGAPIAPDGICQIVVVFHSTDTRTFNGTLTIESNAANAPSASGPLTGKGFDITFNPPQGGSTSATVAAGGTGVIDLLIGGTPGASGTAALTCTENIPNAFCGVTPSSVTLNDTTPSSVKVTLVTLNEGSTMPISAPSRPQSMPPSWVGMLVLGLMLGIVALPQRRTRLAMAGAMLLVLMWTSCVGNSPRAPTPRITPAGTYNVTVNATVNGVTKSQMVTFTVTP